MDDGAERIPIDLGYEVAASAEAADQRVTVRNDGTLVIDILGAQPCAPDPVTEDEIVVCAAAPEDASPLPPPPPARNPVDRFSDALTFKLGGIELGLIKRPDGQRALGLRTEF
ncbi:MAG TPA: hypothetical protein VI168_18400 [Croceibacterium sp.]